EQAEVAVAELFAAAGDGVARFHRHRHHAVAELARGRDQDLRLEHETLAWHALQCQHGRGIQALATLAVEQAEAAAPGDAPVAEVVAEAPVPGLGAAFAQARAVDDVARVRIGRGDQARDVARIGLAVVVHRHDRSHAATQRLGHTVAQRAVLYHASASALTIRSHVV